MATHKLGKLKFNLSKQGLAYRWGEGEIRRLSFPFGKKEIPTENEYDDMYAEYSEDGYAKEGYDDGYADEDAVGYDDGYDQDAYADDGYGDYEDEAAYADDYEADDQNYDDGYDDPGYEDDYYDDGYGDSDYDDGYDEGYDRDYDDGYDDGYGEYDDRYSDEDANEAYEGGYYEGDNALLQYVDENDWVTYVLLFLLPPLGIYLLWRRNRHERLFRIILSALSAIWFVVALILIFSMIFGGEKDDPSIVTMPSLSPTVAVTATPRPTAEPTVNVSVSPTPITGSIGGNTGTTQYVYSPASGLYYHNNNTCSNIGSGISTSRVPVEIAKNSRNQTACPLCVTGSGTGSSGGSSAAMYWATAGGTYYHSDEHCSNMKNATQWTQESAQNRGKKPCPVCVSKTQKSLADGDVKLITSADKDKSNIKVYATKGGKYFHMTSNCSGMQGASHVSLQNALLAGKDACPTCCKAAGTLVYCTKGGTNYHLDSDCRGMKNAVRVTLAEAMVLGKTKCSTCIKGSLNVSGGSTTPASTEYYVYGTKNGQYYHTNSTCSGMANAKKYTLKAMIAANRNPCPVCAGSAGTLVYAKKGGTYYHSYATCSGMTHATAGTMAEAMAYGYKRCPKCWSTAGSISGSTGSSSSASGSTGSGSSVISVNSGSGTQVYATKGGTYYHTKSNCSGMQGASRVSLQTAISAGKAACPTCAAPANTYVYSTQGGTYYHTNSGCSGMKNAQRRTLAAALVLNQKACPECVGKTTTTATGTANTAGKSSGIYKTGRSGIKVYANIDGECYHTKADCSGMKGASYVTLETALNYGKKACTKCTGAAARTAYATKNGKYYHYSKSCAGSGAKTGNVGEAVALGYKACPYCVSKTATTANKAVVYKSGTSGIKVYATIEGTYYHAKSNCSGMKGASLITLETALNYAKKACPECLASANKVVYAKSGSKYYHYNRSCAGSGALAGTVAQARAYGMSPCSKCTTATSGSGGISNGTIVSYSAPAATSVYIDLNSSRFYYHKKANCSTTGTVNATKVTLQYAKDWGYKTCPYCNPPTGIAG